jgi:hypothetical protein
LSSADHWTGNPVSSIALLECGPRHSGQSAAAKLKTEFMRVTEIAQNEPWVRKRRVSNEAFM